MTTNPFPGLRPFESSETHLFFGRDGQSEELIRRLGRTRFLAVVGTSGSGKSSLVRAGLLPALQGGLMASAGSDWRVAMFRPGHDPIGNLARALASPEVFGPPEPDEEESKALTEEERKKALAAAEMQTALAETTLRRSSLGLLEAVRQARAARGAGGEPRLQPYENLLVVVDQFEELFRFQQLIEVENSKEDAAAFVRLLLEAVREPRVKIYVVLTMRSDFLGDCAQFQGLPEAINDGQYLIPRMTRDERRDAVTGPVAVGGGRITEPLVNQLLNDMGDNPDQLPILQHALMRTWDKWESVHHNGEPIDLPHYKAIGGMDEALSLHAEEAFGELTDTQQRIAEKLFKALTEKGADNREIRRPVELREACALAEADESEVVAVVETFRRPGRSFLMPPAGVALVSDSLIDISHESLIRNWTRLRQWTEEEAQSARIYRRLAETAVLHKEGKEALLKDPALQVALDWREKNRPNAAWARRYHPEFETAMSFLDASVAARDAELQERARQQRREVSYKRTRLAAFFLAFSLILSLAAVGYSTNRLVRAQEAMSLARASEARATEARARAEEALGLAQAERDKAKEETKVAEEREDIAEDARAEALDAMMKAEMAKTEADRQKEIALKREQQANVALRRAEAESAYNAKVAAENAERTKQTQQLLYPAIMNLAQQAYETNDIERARQMLALQTSAVSDRPGFEWFYLNRLINPERETLAAPEGELKFAAVAPDGKTFIIASGTTVNLRDIKTGETRSIKIAVTTTEDFSAGCLAVSRDGKRLAVGNSQKSDPAVKLYDLGTGKELGTLKDGARPVISIAFTPDGKRLITGGNRQTAKGARWQVKVWDAETLKMDASLPPENPEEESSSFARDFRELAVSPDGKTLAVAPEGASVELWDLAKREKTGELEVKSGSITAIAFSPDGKAVATAGLHYAFEVWDAAERKKLWSKQEVGGDAFALAFSPDGRYLATGGTDGIIRIYESGKGERRAVLKGHRETVTSLSFSPDGRLLLSCDNQRLADEVSFGAGEDTTVKAWDVAALVHEQSPVPLVEASGIVTLAYSPDGRTLVATGDNSRVMLLDAETNRVIRTLYGEELSVSAVAFSPDGRLLATAVSDDAVRFWNVADGSPAGAPIEQKSVNSMVFSRDGHVLFTDGAADGSVVAWDVASRKAVRHARGEGDDADKFASKLMLSRDGGTLAFKRNKAVEFWDTSLTRRLRRFEIPEADEGEFFALALSPDGKVLAVGDSYGRARLYDTDSFQLIATLDMKKEAVLAIAFSPDGKTVVTGGEVGTLKFWSTASFRELVTMRAHRSNVRAAVFSPDGTKLATIGEMSDLKVWHARDNTHSAAPAATAAGR